MQIISQEEPGLTQSETNRILETLRGIPLFQSLSDAELTAILESPANGIESYQSKALIVRESEIGNCMYAIIEGTVEVTLRGETGGREVVIATLHTGDFFGEQALLPGGTGRRNASVRALYPSKLFRIDKQFVLLSVNRNKRGSEDDTPVPLLDEPEDKEIKELLHSMRFFRSLAPEEINAFRNWTEILDVGPGEFVIKEDEPGEHLFVVLDGAVEIFTIDKEGKILILAELKRGNYFGEQALLPGSEGKRTAFVRTEKRGRLIKIPKSYFRLILNRDSKLADALTAIGEKQKAIKTILTKP